MAKLLMQVILQLTFCTFVVATERQLVAYWGQNAAGPIKSQQEKRLSEYCSNYPYDVIVIGFVDTLFDTRNEHDLPGTDFSRHCSETFSPDYPFLNKCDEIAEDITTCQEKGKKILISIGGATADGTLQTPSRAAQLADMIWRLFLGGSFKQRPFGDKILDGINLDIQGGRGDYYAEFVSAIRQYERQNGSSRKYLITASPFCMYPDHFLGPGGNTAFEKLPSGSLDGIYVKFYDAACSFDGEYAASLNKWLTSAKSKNTKIFIGLPADKKASSDNKYYQSPENIRTIYEGLKSNSNFEYIGGFMLWEASFDTNNVIDGKTYSKYLSAILKEPTN